MADMSNYLEQQLLLAIFKQQSYSASATYIALLTAAADDSSTGSSISEPSTAAGYARVLAAAGDWSNPAAVTDGTIYNVNPIEWEDVTWSATIAGVAICDAQTGGNVLFYADLATPKQVDFDDTVRFAANALVVQIDD